jgi:hypothetical protein
MLLPSAGGSDPSSNNGTITGKPQGVVDTLLNAVDPSGIRTQLAGLYKGGVSSLFNRKREPTINAATATNSNNPLTSDWRVRVGLMQWVDDPQNFLMAPLKRTNNAVVFPYTPTISVTHNARYQEQALTHSNYKNYFYEGSDVAAINIVGDFTVQNHDEALYLLAAIYFFRTCTKMYFGNDANAGNPPPLVALDGYGDFYFPHVSCVITSFQHTMPADVDYLEIKYAEGGNGKIASANQKIVRLPTSSQINLTLQPVYSRKNIANNMTLTEFSRGHLIKGKGGFL